MSTTLTSILVVGPTGVVGLAIMKELIANKERFTRIAAFNNTARTGDPKKQSILDSFKTSGVEIVSGTYTDVDPFKGFDAVLMPLGNFANYLQPQIIDSAIAAGVRHFYPSEFGADITVGDNWVQRYYRDKVLTREYLAKKDKEVDGGIGWSYVTIGRFTEWATIGYFGVDNANASATIYGDENGRQSLISVPDAAALTVRSLLLRFGPDAESRHRTFRFHGESPTWKDIFSILKRITGHDYKVDYRPTSEALAMSKEADDKHDDKLAMNASHRVVQGSNGTLLPEPYDNDKFPDVKVKGVEEVLEKEYRENKEWYGL